MLGESTYKYLTGDEKTLLEDDSVDVTADDHGKGGTLPGVSWHLKVCLHFWKS